MDHINNLNKLIKNKIKTIGEELQKRRRKISIFDTISFALNSVKAHTSQQYAACKVNSFKNGEVSSRQAYIKQNAKISSDHLRQLSTVIQNYNEDNFSKNTNELIEKYAVDGTQLSINKLLANENYSLHPNGEMAKGFVMSVYKINNNDPITMQLLHTAELQ